MLRIAWIAHLGLAIMALAMVGFWCMFINVLQQCVAYSGYLTLRERQVIFYLFLLLVQVVYDLLGMLGIGNSNDHETVK